MKAGFLLAFAIVFVFSGLLSNDAVAQEKKRPRTLMEMLFSGKKVEQKQPAVTVKNRPKAKKKKSPSVAKAPAEPEALVKLETAKTVMVVGDFLGASAASGLVPVYNQNAGVKVVDRTQGSSGFVRNDSFDWPAEIKALIESERPAAVVVMIGANDRQQMKIDGERAETMTEAWVKEYTARTAAFAAVLAEKRVPLVWVGLPSFKSTKLSKDAIALNDIYRQAATAAGGVYVDIWDGFVDEKGAFVSTGPDINGQSVRLRNSDGINFSRSGERKVGFYVEKPLQKMIGGETLSALNPLGFGAPPITAFPGGIAMIDRTSPVSLMDPELDGGSELLGLVVSRKRSDPDSLGDKLAVKGIAPAATSGRADDFGGAVMPTATSDIKVP